MTQSPEQHDAGSPASSAEEALANATNDASLARSIARSAEIEAMTPEQVNAAAKVLASQALTWLVVGDLSKTQGPVEALKLGEVTVLDADGKPVVKK